MTECNTLRFDTDNVLPSGIKKKLASLHRSGKAFKIAVLSEVAEDSLWLNGVAFSTHGWLFPMAVGWDVGCGYRVCLISDKAISYQTLFPSYLNLLGDKAMQWQNEIQMHSLLSNPREWTASIGLSSNVEPPDGINEALLRHLDIPIKTLARGLCQLALGNHFIELRKKADHEDHGNCLAIIHSGVGKLLETEYMRTVARVACRFGRSLSSGSAYSFRIRLDDERTIPLLAAIKAYKIIAWANRSILGNLLVEALRTPLQTLWDEAHDEITVSGDIVMHKKGAQEYTRQGYAVIPGNMDEEAYIVQSTGESRFINHSPGEAPEGTDGKNASICRLITNIEKAPLRKFRSVDSIIDSARSNNLFTVCSKWSPHICIKAVGV